MTSSPSIGLISFRRQRAVPWFGWIRAMEDLITDAYGASVHEVGDVRTGLGPLESRGRLRAGAARLGVSTRSWTVDPAGVRHDVVVVVANDPSDLSMLLGLPGWADLAPVRVLLVNELWLTDIGRLQPALVEAMRCFQVIGTSFEPAVAVLGAMMPGTVVHVPVSCDTTLFGARRPGFSPIDVLNVGRRDARQHRWLSAWAEAEQRWYQFDTGPLTSVFDLAEHAAVYGRTAARSSIMICNFARCDDPDRTGPLREVGLRWYEALAAGCVIAGRLPAGDQYQRDFGHLAGVVALPDDEPEAAQDVLRDLLDDQSRRDSIAVAHRAAALRRHDVVHRATQLLGAAGVEPGPAMVRRTEALTAEALRLEELV